MAPTLKMWSFIKKAQNFSKIILPWLHECSPWLQCAPYSCCAFSALIVTSGKCKILWSKFLQQLMMDWKDLISFGGVCQRKTDQWRSRMHSASCRCSLNFCSISIKYQKYLQKYCLTESNQLVRLKPSTYQNKPTAGTPQQLKKHANTAV